VLRQIPCPWPICARTRFGRLAWAGLP
jgi:hypothetical protein